MDRSELEGVLPGLAIRSSDEKDTVNEIAERLKALGVDIKLQSWGVGVEKWLSFLRKNPDAVKPSETMTPRQVAVLRDDLGAARRALDEEEERTAELPRQVEERHQTRGASQWWHENHDEVDRKEN